MGSLLMADILGGSANHSSGQIVTKGSARKSRATPASAQAWREMFSLGKVQLKGCDICRFKFELILIQMAKELLRLKDVTLLS